MKVSITPSASTVLSSETEQYSVSASEGYAPYFYDWKVDGSTTGVTNPVFRYANTTGNYSIKCTVTDSRPAGLGGAQVVDSNVATLEVIDPPEPLPLELIVDIAPVRALSITANDAVSFTSRVRGGTPSYTYAWYVNDEVAEGEVAETFLFEPSGAGIYNIYLEVTDSADPAVVIDSAITQIFVRDSDQMMAVIIDILDQIAHALGAAGSAATDVIQPQGA